VTKGVSIVLSKDAPSRHPKWRVHVDKVSRFRLPENGFEVSSDQSCTFQPAGDRLELAFRGKLTALSTAVRNVEATLLVGSPEAVEAETIQIDEASSAHGRRKQSGVTRSNREVFVASDLHATECLPDRCGVLFHLFVNMNEFLVDVSDQCSFRSEAEEEACRSREWFYVARETRRPVACQLREKLSLAPGPPQQRLHGSHSVSIAISLGSTRGRGPKSISCMFRTPGTWTETMS